MSEQDIKKWLPFVLIGVILVAPVLIPFIILGGLAYYVTRMRSGDRTTIHYQSEPLQRFTMTTHDMFGKAKGVAGGIVLLVLVALFLYHAIVIVPAGKTGVYHLFGAVRDAEVSSGIHIINPLATVQLMSIRTEQYTMSIAAAEGQRYGDDSISALTKEGLRVDLDITVLYRLREESASEVYKTVGVTYEEKILRPQVRSAIREVVALYEAKDIYSERREEVAQKIDEILREGLDPRGITIESVLLRNVTLPAMLTSAIEDKLTAEQEAEKYDFVLQREEKEAERKRIEAAGQRDAQRIITESLTNSYLQYLYIRELKEREGTIYVPYDLPLFRGL